MKEKFQAIAKKLLKRADLVAIVVFLALLVSTGLIYMREAGAEIEERTSNPAPEWNRQIPSDNFNRIKDSFLDAQPDIEQDPKIQRLVQINMFDLKSVRSQAELEAEVQADYTRAENLFGRQDYDGALQLVEAILQKNPVHTRSLELRERIQAARQQPPEGSDSPPPAESSEGP